jgi:DNA polymerase III subunit gamma/tau
MAPPSYTQHEASDSVRVISRFDELIALAAERRDLATKTALERDVRLVRMEDGRLEIALEPGASKALAGDLSRKLSDWTGRRWMVVVSAEAGAPTVRAQADERRQELRQGVQTDPLVQAVLSRFPGAEIVGVQPRDDVMAGLPGELSTDDALLATPEPGNADDEL